MAHGTPPLDCPWHREARQGRLDTEGGGQAASRDDRPSGPHLTAPHPRGTPSKAKQDFCAKYDCTAEAIDVHHGTGGDGNRHYFAIVDPEVALEVILIDAGMERQDDGVIARTPGGGYREGRLIDIEMTVNERDPPKRGEPAWSTMASHGGGAIPC